MLRFITLVLLCTWYLHIHTAAEQVSKIPLTLTFSNNLSTTIEEPFLGRFIALYQKTEQPGEHSVHIPNTVDRKSVV